MKGKTMTPEMSKWNSERIAQLNAMRKDQLARMHVDNGGLMGFNTYLKWSKDELVSTVLQDEILNGLDD